MKPDHLVKVLAEHGVASRRACERLIREGEVTVDGRIVTEPGSVVDSRAQTIQVGGEPLPPPPRITYLMLHKPKGVITTRNDPEDRKTVFELIEDPHPALAAVGRLDYWTEGLLLLTTDGELAYRLTHPSYQVAKTYLVKVTGTPQPRKLKELERGIELEDGKTAQAAVELVRTVGPSSWLLITIVEGRNRIIRRMVEAIGHRTLKLKRVGLGGLAMKSLDPGQYRELSRGEVEHIKRVVAQPVSKPRLTVPYQVREAVAEALRLPKPERPKREQRVRGRDEEGRPFRAKGWARPKAKKGGRPGDSRRKGRGNGRGGSGGGRK
ncbi:MAG: rRNA pseudouridine synthase [Deltaproteobacteria bacterium]|nr:rRNA pseudouridine synthase [Deltaproteobacteria bacterium]